jgi:hypothetical protein
VLRVFYSSIQANGVAFGIIVGIFKIAASLLLVLVALMGLTKDKSGRYNFGLLGVLIGGASLWVLYKLINEEAVRERLERESDQTTRSPKTKGEYKHQKSDYGHTSSTFDYSAGDTEEPGDGKPERIRDWWEVLGVPRTAILGEVKTAYREQLKRYHPDRVAGLGIKLRQVAEEECKALNAAYEEASKELNNRKAAAAAA